jgi:hypothetical protein
VVAVSLPRSSYAANISGAHHHGKPEHDHDHDKEHQYKGHSDTHRK